jgi:hypothetical protein
MRTTSEIIALTHLRKAEEYYLADRLEHAHSALMMAFRAGVYPGNVFDRQRTIEAELAARRAGQRLRIEEHLVTELPAELPDQPRICAIVADCVRDVTELWSVRWGKPVLITVFATRDAVTFVHGRYGYYTERTESHKVCLPPQTCRDTDHLRLTIRHEVAHAAVHARAGDRIPNWLGEGIAVWTQGPLDAKEQRWLSVAAVTGLLRSLDKVESVFGNYDVQLNSRESAVAYSMVGGFVGYLIERFGLDRFRRVLAELGRHGDVARALRNCLGSDLGTLEEDWRADLVRRAHA